MAQTVPAKPLVTITPQMVVDSSLQGLPNFTARKEFELLVMILTSYVGSDSTPVLVQLGPKKALKNLITLKKVSGPEDIDAAYMIVMKALSASMNGVFTSFEASTQKKYARSDFDAFETEYTREQAEQGALIGKSEKAIERVRTLCGSLGIPNPDPALNAAPVKATPKENHLGKLARSVGSVFFSDGKPKANASTSISSKPGWATPPVLNKRFTELEDFVTMIEDYVKELEALKKTQTSIDIAKTTLDYFAGQGFGRDIILRDVTEYVTIARDQITQSKEIKSNIQPEYDATKVSVEAINDVRSIADAVKGYFE